ncbi:hypothetical protein LguiA_001971 [Lonicera macranthoides]
MDGGSCSGLPATKFVLNSTEFAALCISISPVLHLWLSLYTRRASAASSSPAMSTIRHHHSRSSSTTGNDNGDDEDMGFRFTAPRNGDGVKEDLGVYSNLI